MSNQYKKIQIKSLPTVFDGMGGSQDELGHVSFYLKNNDMQVEWTATGKTTKTALWRDLCTNMSFQRERVELGFLLSNILFEDYRGRIMDALSTMSHMDKPSSHSLESLADAKETLSLYKSWRYWALSQPTNLGFPNKPATKVKSNKENPK